VKSNYNYEKPFLYLLRKLTNDPALIFVEQVSLLPPEVHISAEDVARMEEEMKAAENIGLLPEDDDENF